MMRTIHLNAISATAIAHGLHDHLPNDVCDQSLTPKLMKPVFDAPPDVAISEAVAVAFRDADGVPIHGGLFGIISGSTPDHVVKLVLIDEARGVNTDADPKWTAFGLNMSLGKLLIRQDGRTVDVPWSIVDFGVKNLDGDIPGPTPARIAVRDAYVREVVPTLAVLDQDMATPAPTP